jgi:hypothetical protein
VQRSQVAEGESEATARGRADHDRVDRHLERRERHVEPDPGALGQHRNPVDDDPAEADGAEPDAGMAGAGLQLLALHVVHPGNPHAVSLSSLAAST